MFNQAQSNAFSDDDVVILQTLADQLALAIDNAGLFYRDSEHAQRTRHDKPAIGSPGLAAQGSSYYQTAFTYEPIKGIKPVVTNPLREITEDNRCLVSPIVFRGQALGSIALQPRGNRANMEQS